VGRTERRSGGFHTKRIDDGAMGRSMGQSSGGTDKGLNTFTIRKEQGQLHLDRGTAGPKTDTHWGAATVDGRAEAARGEGLQV
jgi:hypothetical protein